MLFKFSAVPRGSTLRKYPSSKPELKGQRTLFSEKHAALEHTVKSSTSEEQLNPESTATIPLVQHDVIAKADSPPVPSKPLHVTTPSLLPIISSCEECAGITVRELDGSPVLSEKVGFPRFATTCVHQSCQP